MYIQKIIYDYHYHFPIHRFIIRDIKIKINTGMIKLCVTAVNSHFLLSEKLLRLFISFDFATILCVILL